VCIASSISEQQQGRKEQGREETLTLTNKDKEGFNSTLKTDHYQFSNKFFSATSARTQSLYRCTRKARLFKFVKESGSAPSFTLNYPSGQTKFSQKWTSLVSTQMLRQITLPKLGK
jgi:hypothetical protein